MINPYPANVENMVIS